MSENKPIAILLPDSYVDKLKKAYSRDSIAEKECLVRLSGVQIYRDKYLPKKWVQTRFPKSKKKRIRQKFAKKYGKWQEQAFVIDPKYILEFDGKIDNYIFNDPEYTKIPFSTWYW